ncbi:hypothetical protein V5P93_006253 [Actinokineospora auranticolor]|uniref:Secreted protein n=1 Tax=Actinokineospora auranticolor TaxID=155976 RepID=A0A2S6GI23_9PSEU|nr:hypothetical protein [Actinokineospora auranticolor]PPK64850.1 hypothetical protein CLV40_11789 [Actinokineospora auranticolor]
MKTATKVSAFGLALAVVFVGAWAAGAVVGPLGDDPAEHARAAPPPEHGHDAAPAGDPGHNDGHDHSHAAADPAQLPGLSSAAGGYRLDLGRGTVTTGATEDLTFRVLGPGGAPVTAFDVEHEKRLHLVLVRRDGSGFQHLHPEMAADGTWRLPLTVPAAGSYRVFADFKPTGAAKTTLGADIQAAGRFDPVTHSPVRTFTVDGFEVKLDGELIAGKASTVTLTVTKDGVPVTDLQPHLGAYGHLVALRATDLGYLHVHPIGEPGDGVTKAGPQIRFAVEVPTDDRYRVFLDFRHNDVVRTAEFTVDTQGGAHGEGGR